MIYINDFSRKFELSLNPICSHSPNGTRIISYHNAYHGIKYNFLDFWLQKNSDGKPTCAICRYYSTLILCGECCDETELKDFVSMLSPEMIMSDSEYSFSQNYACVSGEIMVCKKTLPLAVENHKIHRSLSDMSYLRKVYDLLCRTYDGISPDSFEDYFIDMSHKIRHASAEIYSIYEENKPISTAAVTALSDTSAVIGCVATDYESRNKGCASALVQYITEKHLRHGREVYLQRERHIDLYEKIGYVVSGTWYEYRFVSSTE